MSDVFWLILWRDSVCAGDDCDAPHEVLLPLPRDVSLRGFAERLFDRTYLAKIEGGEATWILQAQRPLAVFAQQWAEPRFLVSPDATLLSLFEPNARPHLQFRYGCQVDPARVFECLQSGQPLPDRYGR
jgi:hypothetical protein